MSKRWTSGSRYNGPMGTAVNYFGRKLNSLVDKVLPSTQNANPYKPNKKIGGQAMDEYDQPEVEEGEAFNTVTSAHTKDFITGIRALFITNLVLGITYLCSFIILISWRWSVLNNIIWIPLVTIFSIFNSDPTSHPGQFYPVVWHVGSYPVDVLFLTIFVVAMAACIIRMVAIGRSAFKNENDLDARGGFAKMVDIKTGQIKTPTKTTDDTSYLYWDETFYETMERQNFYIMQVYVGDFYFRWIEWFIDGGLLLWSIATICGIGDVFLLSTIIILFAGVMVLGSLHEHMNKARLTQVEMKKPIIQVPKKPLQYIINRRPKKWYAFILGMFLNAWILVVIFVYYGYAYTFEGVANAFSWYRLTTPIISGSFYFIIIPLIMFIWTLDTLWKPTHYPEIGKIQKISSTKNETTVVDDEEFKKYVSSVDSEQTFYTMTPRLQEKVGDFMFYQDWNKNYTYEILMLVAGGLCKHLVIWIFWAGMM